MNIVLWIIAVNLLVIVAVIVYVGVIIYKTEKHMKFNDIEEYPDV